MTQKRDTILKFIESRAFRPMKVKEMARELGIPASEYTGFREIIKSLLGSGELVRLKRGRVGLADQMDIAVGTLSITRSGTGFLIREGEDVDILIPSHELLTSFDGDKVMVRLRGRHQGRETGTVIKILERVDRNIVGLFRKERHFSVVTPDNPRIHRDIYIPESLTGKATDGDKVVVKITLWEDPFRNPEGEVVETLGRPTDPGVDMLTVIRSFGLPQEFPAEVMDEAEQAAGRLTKLDQRNRRDFTKECIYTIDPADAKDYDDAVSVSATPTGYRLGVHIADVSHFVEPGSALDLEAFDRGNSVYLPGMVIPMIPEVLSNDVCSLKPNRRRLAHSVIVDFDKNGKMLSWEVVDAVIKSQAKLSYEEVQDLFEGKPVPARVKRVEENLHIARKLATLLSRRRFAEGSLDFDLPESKIILNEKGEVLELGNRVRLESHRLVEEFMLAANRAVALEVFRKAQPFLYRVHDKPDMEKLEAFSSMMTRLGYKFTVSKSMKPVQFSRFLRKVEDTPEVDFINELMLRSMQKAVYQRENIGHFGLAFSHYTHFTSPIRRYPDLMVHRLLRKLAKGQYPVAYARKVKGAIDNISRHCSETERTAEAAERQAIKVKQVAYMAHQLGEEFNGIITGVTAYGFFVRLENMGVEGMVRVSSIDDDYYRFDEENYRMIGRRNNRSFRMGDAVRVGVQKVDTVRSEIDLCLSRERDKTAKKSGRKPAKRTDKKPTPKTGFKRSPRKKEKRKKRR